MAESSSTDNNEYSRSRLMYELRRLIDAGKAADIGVPLETDGLSDEDKKILALVTEVLMHYRAVAEYEVRKYEKARKLRMSLGKITKSPAVSAGDLKAAADLIAKEGCRALVSSRVTVWRLSEQMDVLYNISCYDSMLNEYDKLQDIDLLVREEYMHMLNSERLIIVDDVKNSKVLLDIVADGYGMNMCATLDAPIRVDGKLTGVVCVEQDYCEQHFEKRVWEIEEQNYASSLADLMALAISGFERRVARDEAERASEVKSLFLANMSHEIRTPMNTILGVTEILSQNENLTPEVKEGLDRIFVSSDLLLGIINDILDLSKIEAGRLDILSAPYKSANMINNTIQLNIVRLASKPIKFSIRIDENIPMFLIGDELRIKQILNNLLSNAFKYTDTGEVKLTIISESAS